MHTLHTQGLVTRVDTPFTSTGNVVDSADTDLLHHHNGSVTVFVQDEKVLLRRPEFAVFTVVTFFMSFNAEGQKRWSSMAF